LGDEKIPLDFRRAGYAVRAVSLGARPRRRAWSACAVVRQFVVGSVDAAAVRILRIIELRRDLGLADGDGIERLCVVVSDDVRERREAVHVALRLVEKEDAVEVVLLEITVGHEPGEDLLAMRLDVEILVERLAPDGTDVPRQRLRR